MKHTGREDADRWTSGYLGGVADLAALCSEQAGRSSVTAAVYPREGWLDAFCRDYRILRKPALITSEETFKETLRPWLGDALGLADNAAELVEYRLGPAESVWRAADEKALLKALSGSERGFGAYYTTEDVFFAVFGSHAVAWILGNNE